MGCFVALSTKCDRKVIIFCLLSPVLWASLGDKTLLTALSMVAAPPRGVWEGPTITCQSLKHSPFWWRLECNQVYFERFANLVPWYHDIRQLLVTRPRAFSPVSHQPWNSSTLSPHVLGKGCNIAFAVLMEPVLPMIIIVSIFLKTASFQEPKSRNPAQPLPSPALPSRLRCFWWWWWWTDDIMLLDIQAPKEICEFRCNIPLYEMVK